MNSNASPVSRKTSQSVAIIGSGIAGMTVARLLSPHHEVHLFEAGEELGGHTATKDIQVASGTYAIDTGFIVFNDWTYPNFIRLLTQAGVAWKDSEMSFSVRNDRIGLEYNGADLPHLFAQKRNLFRPSFYRMLLEILRFNREAPALLARKTLPFRDRTTQGRRSGHRYRRPPSLRQDRQTRML